MFILGHVIKVSWPVLNTKNEKEMPKKCIESLGLEKLY
jgi:hypothetical protein